MNDNISNQNHLFLFLLIEISETWNDALTQKEGVTFCIKSLGSMLVEELEEGVSYGDSVSAEAVSTIVNMV